MLEFAVLQTHLMPPNISERTIFLSGRHEGKVETGDYHNGGRRGARGGGGGRRKDWEKVVAAGWEVRVGAG